MTWFHLPEVPREVKFRDRTQNGGGDWGQEDGEMLSQYLTGTESQFGKMQKFSRRMVGMVIRQRECT